MKLKIVSVHGHGNFKEEYVLLQAFEDCNAHAYVLADTTYTSKGSISNKVRHTYWLPDWKVKKGEYISVWTKAGTDTSGKLKNGEPVHRFYWGLEEAIWNDTGDCAVLIEIGDSVTFTVKKSI